MDQDFQKLMQDNNRLIKENLELTRQNSQKIKRIQAYIRRTLVVKTLYWIIVIIVTIGAVYLSKPYINNAIDTYGDFKENLNRSTEIINNPGSVFKDVNLVESIFGS